MPMENNFSQNEIELIKSVKQTLKILSKVIKDKAPGEVIKDIEPKDVIGDGPIAKIIKKSNFLERMKDFDPYSDNANDELDILVDELANKIQSEDNPPECNEDNLKKYITKLARAIIERLTPDIPGLNPKDERLILGNLLPTIYTRLRQDESTS